jgi:NAD-dependent dihydropyrimidine dehydrogenase PreA subunit
MNTLFIVIGVLVLLWIVGNIVRKVQNKNKIVYVVEGNCTGCGRCLKRCNYNVLELVRDEKGKRGW